MIKVIIAVLIGLACSFPAFADTYVRGYTKSDGTYVQPHYRSDSNSTVRDNFSYKGNTNPYNGSTGTNRYESNPSSEYYNGNSRSDRSSEQPCYSAYGCD